MASGGKKKVGFFGFHALSFTPVEFLENIGMKKKESFFSSSCSGFSFVSKPSAYANFFFCNSRSVFQ